MIAILALLLWIAILVVVIKGRATSRIVACLIATAAVVALTKRAFDVGQSSAMNQLMSEVARPMQYVMADLNDTANRTNTALLGRKLRKTEEVWLLYTCGRTNVQIGCSEIIEMQ